MKKIRWQGSSKYFRMTRAKWMGFWAGNKAEEIERGHIIKHLVCNTIFPLFRINEEQLVFVIFKSNLLKSVFKI